MNSSFHYLEIWNRSCSAAGALRWGVDLRISEDRLEKNSSEFFDCGGVYRKRGYGASAPITEHSSAVPHAPHPKAAPPPLVGPGNVAKYSLNNSHRRMQNYSGRITAFSGITASVKEGAEVKVVQPGLERALIFPGILKDFYCSYYNKSDVINMLSTTNRDPVFKSQSRSRFRSKTNPEKSVIDFHFKIDPRFSDQNRISIFILKSIHD